MWTIIAILTSVYNYLCSARSGFWLWCVSLPTKCRRTCRSYGPCHQRSSSIIRIYLIKDYNFKHHRQEPTQSGGFQVTRRHLSTPNPSSPSSSSSPLPPCSRWCRSPPTSPTSSSLTDSSSPPSRGSPFYNAETYSKNSLWAQITVNVQILDKTWQ